MDSILAGLAPEEIDELEEAIGQHRRASNPMDHPDEQQDKDMMAPIAQALEMIAQRLEAAEEAIQQLSSFIFDDLIGGIKGLYDDNDRSDSLGLLKAKYGESFGPHEGLLSKIMGGSMDDFYGKVHDHMKGHWDDEGFDPDDFIDSILDEIDDLREAAGSGPKMAVIHETTEEPEGKGFSEEIRKLRGRR